MMYNYHGDNTNETFVFDYLTIFSSAFLLYSKTQGKHKQQGYKSLSSEEQAT